MSWNDDEAIEQERWDSDMEQAQFEAEGNRLAALKAKSDKALAEGDKEAAANLCPHGGGYPLDSPAAHNNDDPNAGEDGVRCYDCGSRLSAFVWDGGKVLIPCEWSKS